MKIKANKNKFLAKDIFQLADQAYYFGSPWSQEQFSENLNEKTHFYLVLEEKEQLIGFISYQCIFDEAQITHIAIHPTYKKQKLGYTLLLSVLEQLQEKEIQSLFLEVRQSNSSAKHLYQKIGFEPLYTRKNYYQSPKEDALVMKLDLRKWQNDNFYQRKKIDFSN